MFLGPNKKAYIPTTLAFVGDWHKNTDYALQTIEKLARLNVDTILHTGDLVYSNSTHVQEISNTLVCTGINLFMVDGNHDNHSLLNNKKGEPLKVRRLLPNLYYLPRGYAWLWDNIRFASLGGAASMDKDRLIPGVSYWDAECLSAKDVQTFVSNTNKTAGVDVVISHDCPSKDLLPGHVVDKGRKIWGAERMRAAEKNRRLLAQALNYSGVKLLVHGHYHYRYDNVWSKPDFSACKIVGLDCERASLQDNCWVVTMDDIKNTVKNYTVSAQQLV